MNTLTQRDVRAIADGLAMIKELTDLLRNSPSMVSRHQIYDAAAAEMRIRELIMAKALGAVGVDDVSEDLAWVKTLLTKEPI